MRDSNRDNRHSSRGDKPDPLQSVEWCRVIDQPEVGSPLVVVTEPNMHVIRLKPKPNTELQATGSRIYMGADVSKKDIVEDILGFARIRDLSTRASAELPVVLQQMIESSPDVFIQDFFNRAGSLNLKMHAFELLPGVGNKKAIEMVQKRGRVGWDTFESLNQDCAIDAPELLAKRFVSEIEDRGIQPRLIDLLLRKEE